MTMFFEPFILAMSYHLSQATTRKGEFSPNERGKLRMQMRVALASDLNNNKHQRPGYCPAPMVRVVMFSFLESSAEASEAWGIM
jgi:hypothetical protein